MPWSGILYSTSVSYGFEAKCPFEILTTQKLMETVLDVVGAEEASKNKVETP